MALINEMLAGFADIFKAPFKSLEALWVLIPLIIMWVVLEIYFARYKKEELGWNTALANGITLGWLTLSGMRAIFEVKSGDFWLRFIANIIILFYAGLIIYFSFTHRISQKWNFALADPTPVYFLGIFSVMWGFGTLDINKYVLLDLIILFALLNIILFIFRHLVKESDTGGVPKMPEEKGPGGFGGLGNLPDLGNDSKDFPKF